MVRQVDGERVPVGPRDRSNMGQVDCLTGRAWHSKTIGRVVHETSRPLDTSFVRHVDCETGRPWDMSNMGQVDGETGRQ